MKLKLSLKNILPGIFLIGFNIGTGSVTAMSKAGADFGMSLLWTLVISCIFTFVLIHIFGKFTIVSGLTSLHAIRKNIHPAVAIFFLIALGVNVSGSIIGVMGIVCDVLHEWSKDWIQGGISSLAWSISITIFVIILIMIGNSRFFQKALSVLVGIMAVSFILNAIFMFPSIKEIMQGLIPKIPETQDASISGYLIAASMVGTTVAPVIFVARSILVRDEGWALKDLGIQKKDALVSASMIFIIGASIMASAAGTLHVQGISLINAKDMVQLLKPVAGIFAVNIFVLGITAAGISSQFPNIFIVPWIISDYKGVRVDMKSRTVRLIVIGMASLGIIVPLFNAQPIWVMVASQALGAILLPVTVGSIIFLSNSKKLMGEHRPGLAQNIILGTIFIFSIIMCTIGIYGLIN